jgi:hypothetical protein
MNDAYCCVDDWKKKSSLQQSAMNFRTILLFVGKSPSLDASCYCSSSLKSLPQNREIMQGVAHDSHLDSWFVDFLVAIALFSSGLCLPALIVIIAS